MEENKRDQEINDIVMESQIKLNTYSRIMNSLSNSDMEIEGVELLDLFCTFALDLKNVSKDLQEVLNKLEI